MQGCEAHRQPPPSVLLPALPSLPLLLTARPPPCPAPPQVHGIYWGSYQQHEPRLFRRSLEEVARLLAAGDIEVAVSHKYSLAQAGEAFSVMLGRGVVGKMLLLPGPRSML